MSFFAIVIVVATVCVAFVILVYVVVIAGAVFIYRCH